MLSEGRPGAPEPRRRQETSTIATRLLEERRARSMSVRELGRLAGVTASLISQIENNKVNPSVGTLYRMAEALGIRVDEFFAGEPTGERAGHGSRGAGGPAGASGNASQPAIGASGRLADRIVDPATRKRIALAGGVQWELLVSPEDAAIEDIEVILSRYPPRSESSSEPMRHHGREYGFILEGALELEVAGEHVSLQPGQSITFESMQPHRLWNAGAVDTVTIWVVHGRRGIDPNAG
jgi:mannose-6-phosphate isomerase-like protein (cupin superfamily)/DNA-binding XRE family transcriptional regulator